MQRRCSSQSLTSNQPDPHLKTKVVGTSQMDISRPRWWKPDRWTSQDQGNRNQTVGHLKTKAVETRQTDILRPRWWKPDRRTSQDQGLQDLNPSYTDGIKIKFSLELGTLVSLALRKLMQDDHHKSEASLG